MGAQRQARGILGREGPQLPGPEQPGGAQLGDLHEEVHADAEEEGEARGEGVDGQPPRERGADIFDAIGDGKGEFLHGRGARLQHVIAGDGDGVELRHLRRGIGDDVGDDAHGGGRRVDIGVADHELF